MLILEPQNEWRANSEGLFHALESRSIAYTLIRTFVFTTILWFRIWKCSVLKCRIARELEGVNKIFFNNVLEDGLRRFEYNNLFFPTTLPRCFYAFLIISRWRWDSYNANSKVLGDVSIDARSISCKWKPRNILWTKENKNGITLMNIIDVIFENLLNEIEYNIVHIP